MIRVVRTLLVMTCVTYCTSCWSDDQKYSFVILVCDEQGKPVPDANLEFIFLADSIPMQDCVTRASTDHQGRAKFTGVAYDLGFMNISKDGYYPTREKMYVYLSSPYVDGKHTDYEPKNAIIEIVLKPKGNQVPMYAKKERKLIPAEALGKPLGYDMLVGDFMAPYGIGKISDILFTASPIENSEMDVRWQLDVEFPNQGDGIQKIYSPVGYDSPDDRGSELRSPTRAPLEGYQAKMHFENTTAADTSRDYVYLIRIRAVLDVNGKVVSAWYGKMYHGPRVGRSYKIINLKKEPRGDYLSLGFHVNPDGTTNLEYSPGSNFFGKLPDENLPGGP